MILTPLRQQHDDAMPVDIFRMMGGVLALIEKHLQFDNHHSLVTNN